jgi:hypothetical protein
MDDDNKYAIVQVLGEELFFDFEQRRCCKSSSEFKTKKNHTSC